MRKLLLCLLWLLMMVIPVASQDTSSTYSDPTDLADADGKFMTVGDQSIYYLDRGPVDGTPVILLHGFLGSVVDWTNTIPALTDAGRRVIAFDRPPFGLSDKRTTLDYSNKAMSALTADIMDELKIDQAVIVGHSLGGTVAAQFVLDYPQRVSKLILVDAAIGITESKPQFDLSSKDIGNDLMGADFLRQLNPDSPVAQALVHSILNPDFADKFLTQAEAKPRVVSTEELRLRTRGLRIKGWEGGILAFARDAFTDKSEIDPQALKRVQTPVLLIWGEADQLVPIQIGEALRDLFPHNQWISYPDMGHMSMYENTVQFNKDLVTFIESKSFK